MNMRSADELQAQMLKLAEDTTRHNAYGAGTDSVCERQPHELRDHLRHADRLTGSATACSVCDQAINAARDIAAHCGRCVIVDDRGTQECCRATPGGHHRRVPRWWSAEWQNQD
jgi:hypothetical protein